MTSPPGGRAFPAATGRGMRTSAGTGTHRVVAEAMVLSNGVNVTLVGGTLPHIGAVAIAVPRPSLADPAMPSATTSVYTVVGHKDDEIARPAAHLLARELGCLAVVTAGVHLDNATQQDVELLVANARRASERLAHRLRLRFFASKE